MKTIQFERTIGKSVLAQIKLGNQKIDYRLYPLISFEERAQMVRAIIESVVYDGTYHAEQQEFMVNYYLLRYYTDISVVGEDDHGELDADAINSIYEIYMTTDIIDDLRTAVVGFDGLMAEIKAGIEFAKQELYHSHGLNRVGDALGTAIQSIGASLTEDDIRGALASFTSIAETLKDAE